MHPPIMADTVIPLLPWCLTYNSMIRDPTSGTLLRPKRVVLTCSLFLGIQHNITRLIRIHIIKMFHLAAQCPLTQVCGKRYDFDPIILGYHPKKEIVQI